MEAEENEVIKENLNTLGNSFLVIVSIVLIVLVIILIVNRKEDTITSDIFNITLKGNSSKYKPDIQKSVDELSDIILKDSFFEDGNKINIDVTTTNSFSSSSTLAMAYMSNSDNIYGGGHITLLDGLETKTNLPVSDIVIHEMLHVLGLGSSTRWTECVDGNYLKYSSGCFPEAFSVYETYTYNGITPPATGGDGIPIQGTSHWDETIFGKEIMTPLVEYETELIISSVTVASLEDLEFTVNMNSQYISSSKNLPF